MIFINSGSCVAYANQKCVEALGYSKEEFYAPDFNFLSLIAPESRDLAADSFDRGKQGEETGTHEYTMLTKDGRKIETIISSCTIEFEKGRALLGTVTDITERKAMEERIIELYKKEKQQRETLQEEAKTRGMFIDVLAHELRTPLTPVLASTGMLKDITDGKTNDIQKKLIDNIYSSADTLAKRLEELLDLARYSRGTFKLNVQPTDLNQFIKEVITRFRPSLQFKKQYLVEEIYPDLPLAGIDASRLEQVIINLLSNASKFSQDRETILFRVNMEDYRLQVDVRDSGIGIPSESQARLFQPYHRVEQDRPAIPGIRPGPGSSQTDRRSAWRKNLAGQRTGKG